MGYRNFDSIDRTIIIKIVKERLIQKGERQEILNSLIKLGYPKCEAIRIIKDSIKELENAGIYLKSNSFVYYIAAFFLVLVIVILFFIFR